MEIITNIDTANKSLTIELLGIVGFDITSEDLGNKINEAKSKGVENIKIILESPGGKMSHALSIYSILKKSGLKIESYLRGANASASTLIASSANVENIYMDDTGLYLIHKPMGESYGNENDFEQSKKDLQKWEKSLRRIYENLGISNEILDDLLNRNNGHGEWLNFEEAKQYGFVGNSWETQAIYNYDNKEIFTINNLITPKIQKMENKENIDEKSLLSKIWDKLSAEPENKETPKNEVSEDEMASIIEAVMEALEPRLKAIEEAMEPVQAMEEEEEEVEAKKEDEEDYKNEIENLKSVVENLKKDVAKKTATAKPTTTNKTDLTNAPAWKVISESYKNFKNL